LKDKPVILSGIGALVLLATLSLPALFLRQGSYRNLLLVIPAEGSTSVFDRQKIGQIAEDEFLLTYEIRRQVSVRTVYAEYPVTVIGTNSLFPLLTAYPMVGGSFFTKIAEEGKIKQAVLNSAAAFRLFGSDNIAGRTLAIAGTPWLVTGVIDDGTADTPHVYIPASTGGEDPRSLLVLLRGGRDIDTVYVKNILKPLGIQETSHLFFDLSGAVGLYEERFTLALRVFICALLCIFIRRQGAIFRIRVLAFKNRLKQKYIGELIREAGGQFAGLILPALALSGGAALCVILLLQIPALCLGWGDMPSLTGIFGQGDFPDLIAPLRGCYYPDAVLFALSLTLTGFMLFLEGLSAANIRG
jgi:hypothetical protein